jgi:hypothetical protein
MGWLLALAAAFSWAQGPALPAFSFDKPGLDGVFDGLRARRAASAPPVSAQVPSFIIRAEEDPLPPAPRFALNLDAVPPSMRSMVEGYDRLFHKNQEETPEWVSEMNSRIRAYNAGRRFGRVPEWTYDGRPNHPPFVCLSYAAGTVNDWWAMRLGRGLPSYLSPANGSVEIGLDPRLLELEYVARARAGGDWHFRRVPTFIENDPVRNTWTPIEPLGYADLLTEGAPFQVRDPVDGQLRSFTPDMSAMEGVYVELFSNNVLEAGTAQRRARQLAAGLEKWGIAYAQLEQTERPRLSGAHAVAVVGSFCMEEDQTLVDCSANSDDEEWARRTWFVVHDSFGDFPADKVRDGSGGSAYRAVRIASIDQAIVFPHGLRVFASPEEGRPGVWRLGVVNKGLRPVRVLSVSSGGLALRPESDGFYRLRGEIGEEVGVSVAARHYFGEDGKPRTFALRLEPRALSEGVELPATRSGTKGRGRFPPSRAGSPPAFGPGPQGFSAPPSRRPGFSPGP